MKLFFVLLSITISCILHSQTLSYNNPCVVKGMHVKTERHYLISAKNDTILKQQNNYDFNGNHVSSKSFFLNQDPGESDTLIFNSAQLLIKRIAYSPSGKIKLYNQYLNDTAGNNISITTVDAKGHRIYKDTSVYNEAKTLIYVMQLTSNKDYPKMKKFFYNNERVLEKEIYNYNEKDSTIIRYTYSNSALNEPTGKQQGPVNNNCKKIWLPNTISIKYGRPKNDTREIREEHVYYTDGRLIKTSVSGVPKRDYFGAFMYYTLYD